MNKTTKRIETKLEVQTYLQNLKYALDHGGRITFQADRRVDNNRDIRYTNKSTVGDLFPDENPITALKRELKKLTVEEYIQTVKDTRFPNRSEMREFGKYMKEKEMFT